MKAGRFRKLAIYCVLWTPALVLCLLLATVAVGVWVSAILHEPELLDQAPRVVRTLAGAAYWRHRTHWQNADQCTELDETLLYKPRPGSCSFSNSEFATTPHFDDLGLRRTADRAQALGRPQGSRVLVLGDSHSMGWGVEDEETYASVLSARYGAEVLNLAVSSYGTARELMRLRLLEVLRPDDLILIQYCNNDLEENVFFLGQESLPRRTPEDFAALQSYRPAPSDPVSVIATLLRIGWEDLTGPLARWSAARPTPPPAAVTFAQVLDRFPELQGHRIFVVEINGHGYQSSFSRELAALDRPGLVVIEPQLVRDDFYQLDDHLTARGHERLAARLAEAIGLALVPSSDGASAQEVRGE